MYRTLDQGNFSGKTVLVRADLNVPMKDGVVTDDTRLVRLRGTLDFLKAAKIVLLSHFGRPEGKRDAKYSLEPVARRLSAVLGREVLFAPDCIGDVAQRAIGAMKAGEILVLENTRFYAEEEKNDTGFANELAKLGDVYVNDAFSAAHRAHASTEALAKLLPAYAGRLMQEELAALERALEKPERPVAALVGGSKISTKLDLLNNLIAKVDVLVLGGGMANTFLAADGVDVGGSLYEKEMLDVARGIATKAAAKGCRLLLPTDARVAVFLDNPGKNRIAAIADIKADDKIFDLGPQSVAAIVAALATCKTVVWNGPLGVFEVAPFDEGTRAVAEAVARLTSEGKLLSVAGGGDTVAALSQAGKADALSYVSSAGGAFLEWLEGKALPGVAALSVD